LECETPTPSPTPSPTAPPTCNAINLEFIQQASPTPVPSFTCNLTLGWFINTTDLCTATTLDRQSDCNRAGLAGYYNDGTNYRYWNGSSFTTSCTLTDCP
jgi:hypothetical protein